VATNEDELAKKQAMEMVWSWAGRLIVLFVVLGAGFFMGYLRYGAGENGAPALRVAKENLEGQLLEMKNKRVDADGKVTVLQTRLEECQKNLNRLGSAGGAPAAP
jgi:hypothetical protein